MYLMHFHMLHTYMLFPTIRWATVHLLLANSWVGQFTGDKTYSLNANVGEKNAVMDHFVFVVSETALVQVVLRMAITLDARIVFVSALVIVGVYTSQA